MRRIQRVVLISAILSLLVVIPAHAGSGGDNNRGTIKVDNVGQSSGSANDQDPHLGCADIAISGSGLADPSGSYSVNSWPPSGSQKVAYTGTWQYGLVASGIQVISVIPVDTLIANAIANGDTPSAQQGYHFKLVVSQDPVKQKTFWVNCPPPNQPPPPPCGSPGARQCPPPPPCTGQTCQPLPPSPTGQPPVIPTSGVTTTVTPPSQPNPKPGKHRHHKAKLRCTRIRPSRLHLWFTPSYPIPHGIVVLHVSTPKSAHVGRIVVRIHGLTNGHRRTLRFRGGSATKSIDVANTWLWGMTFIHGVYEGTWGFYKVTATFHLKCGSDITTTRRYLNADPPPGVEAPTLSKR